MPKSAHSRKRNNPRKRVTTNQAVARAPVSSPSPTPVTSPTSKPSGSVLTPRPAAPQVQVANVRMELRRIGIISAIIIAILVILSRVLS